MHVCPLQYSSRTLPATQFKPGLLCRQTFRSSNQGRIQDFKLGGGGGAPKKIAPSAGRREHFWDLSCEKSRFYAKKSYFFQFRREARKCLGYFVWKITILRQKIIYFPFLGGGRRVSPPPPWIRPCKCHIFICVECVSVFMNYKVSGHIEKKGGIWGGIFIDWDIEGSFFVWFYYVFRLYST